MTKTLERHGLLIFFISILMVTQLRWAERINYDDIAQRLSAAMLVGTLLNWGLGKWLTSFEGQTENEKWQRRIKDISFTLSFSFLWVAFHQDGQLGGGIVFLFLIYLIKSNENTRTWLKRFLNSKNFEVELDEKKEMPVLNIKGKHDPDNLVSFQYLCVDVSEVFFELKDKKNKEVQLDLQVTNTTNEQLLPLIRAIADSHGIELNSKNITPT
jgi:hypothetical protein